MKVNSVSYTNLPRDLQFTQQRIWYYITLQSYMFWYDKKHVYISTIFQIEILDRRMAPFTTF